MLISRRKMHFASLTRSAGINRGWRCFNCSWSPNQSKWIPFGSVYWQAEADSQATFILKVMPRCPGASHK